MLLVDLHVQTPETDTCKVSFDNTLKRAKSYGLDAIAVVDRLASAHVMDLIKKGKNFGISVFVGVEIPTTQGHLLCFHPELDPFFSYEKWRLVTEIGIPDPESIFDLFHSEGGVVLAASPYDNSMPLPMGDHLFDMWALDGIETLTPHISETAHNISIEAASYMNLPAAGGSGSRLSHTEVGTCATLFEGSADNQAQFVELLRGRDYWAVKLSKEQVISQHRPSRPRSSENNRDSSSGPRRSRRNNQNNNRDQNFRREHRNDSDRS